jgi:hypothetical protein
MGLTKVYALTVFASLIRHPARIAAKISHQSAGFIPFAILNATETAGSGVR